MWSILVGLIERWWREKPRLDVVRAVVRLRDAMVGCEKSYEAYRAANNNVSHGKVVDQYGLRRAWERNVDLLSAQVVELGKVLQIFSPELYSEIMDYSGDEVDTLAEDALYKVAKEMEQHPEIDITRIELTDNYRSALGQLDAFIRANFKPEEVHAVAKSRFR
jgi:hypothetical protein